MSKKLVIFFRSWLVKYILSIFILFFMYSLALVFGPNRNAFLFALSGLLGNPQPSDIAQDFIGFRRMVDGRDLYPVMVTAVQEIDVYPNWEPIKSTHPPTAFLLTAPVAFLPWKNSATIWAWISVILIGVSLWSLNISPGLAVIITMILLIWPPASYSLGQLTPIWLAGLALARKYQDHKYLPGILIGIASLTKLFPALLIVPFLIKGKWKTILAFCITWFVSIGIVLFLCPTAISQYLLANKENLAYVTFHSINGSLFYVLPTRLGNFGFICLAAFFPLTIYLGRNIDNLLLFQYLVVALLPLLWIYSLLPLLPILIMAFRKGNISRIIGILTFMIPIFAPSKGEEGAPFVAIIVLLVGVIIAYLGNKESPLDKLAIIENN